MKNLTLTVNGRQMTAPAEGRTLLVDFLRGGLGLTGTHIGCDTTQCGACVVHLDGLAVKSCTVLALDVGQAHVTTIEGMAEADGSLSALQQAFKTCHGLQCGFCTPGMVMSAAALLAQTPHPTETEVRHALEGNICRCTGYTPIIKAILQVAGHPDHKVAAE